MYLTSAPRSGEGFEVLSPGGDASVGRDARARSPSPERATRFLHERAILVTQKPEGLRISTHFYNNEADIDACVEALVGVPQGAASGARPGDCSAGRRLVQFVFRPSVPRSTPPEPRKERSAWTSRSVRRSSTRITASASSRASRRARRLPGKISLYQLRILANDSRVWVPQQNADGVGLRPVITAGDVRKIFTLLGDGKHRPAPQLEGPLQGELRQDADGQPLRGRHRAEGAHLPEPARRPSRSARSGCSIARSSCSSARSPRSKGRPRAAIEEKVDKALDKTFEATPKPARQKPVARRPSDA